MGTSAQPQRLTVEAKLRAGCPPSSGWTPSLPLPAPLASASPALGSQGRCRPRLLWSLGLPCVSVCPSLPACEDTRLVEWPTPLQSHHLHSIRFPDQASLTGTEGRAGPDLEPHFLGKVLPAGLPITALRKCSSPIFVPVRPCPLPPAAAPRGSLGGLHHVRVLPFPTSQLWAECGKGGRHQTLPWGRSSRRGQGGWHVGCSEPQRHRPGAKWLPWGHASSQWQVGQEQGQLTPCPGLFQKQIWLKAAQSGRLFQKEIRKLLLG